MKLNGSPARSRLPARRLAALLAIAWLTAASLAASALQTRAQEPASMLAVYPDRLSAAAGHPARLAVFGREADGSMRDLLASGKATLSVEDAAVAAVTGEGVLAAVGVGQTRLHVRVGDEVVAVPVESTLESDFTFDRDVSAVISKAGCNLGACHGNLHGKGGFRLSLRGDDPGFDFARIAAEYGGRRVDLFEPASSLILKKATNSIAHQGGQRFATDSLEYQQFHRWVEAGAGWQDSPPLVSLSVFPAEIRIAHPERTSRVIVQAAFADGSVRDVTRWSRIEPSIPAGVTVSDEGIVRAERPMDVALNVSYLRGRAAARVAFLGEPSPASPDAAPPGNEIDRLIDVQLAQLGISPEPPADDATFVRRAYLSVIGRLPTAAEARDYLSDARCDKRDLLIDRLLADPGFDLVWAMRWSDLLRNEEKVMSAAGAKGLHNWLREQSAADRPLSDMVAELLTSTGSTYDNPPASFHRTHRDPFTAAESVAQVFLGARIACAKCHNHPFDSWRQDDYYSLAAYFTTIEREAIDNQPKDKLDKHNITGDEIIRLSEKKPEIMHPGLSKMIGPSPLRPKTRPVSTASAPELAPTPLADLAQWLTRGNPMFDRNMANRVWYQYFGKGIVDPPDDVRDSNPPSNPELLDYLANELVRREYSVRQLARMILTSEAFARGSAADVLDEARLPPAPYFAGYPIRRMPAEVLLDAIADTTEVPTAFRSGRRGDDESIVAYKAMEMPGVPGKAGFLTTFGKPERLLACECERTNAVSLGQSLALLNGLEVREKLAEPNNVLDTLAAAGEDSAAVDELYLATLSRYPNSTERAAMLEYVAGSGDRRDAFEDVLWTLLNSKEFIMLR